VGSWFFLQTHREQALYHVREAEPTRVLHGVRGVIIACMKLHPRLRGVGHEAREDLSSPRKDQGGRSLERSTRNKLGQPSVHVQSRAEIFAGATHGVHLVWTHVHHDGVDESVGKESHG